MPVRAVLFDLDGTLVNTLKDIAAAMNHALARESLPTLDAEDIRRLIGGGLEPACKSAGRTDDPATVARLVAGFQSYYASHFAEHAEAYPGIPELITELRERRMPLAVLTNKTHEMAVETIAHVFADSPFEVVLGARAGVPKKPDPTMAFRVCERLGVAPEDAMLIGDSEFDIRAAHNAGMVSVGVTWGFRDADAIAAEAPDHIIDHARALLGLLPL